jgi:Ca-activated chloride channel family protein
MRKPLLTLAAVALVATACSSSSSTSAPSGRTVPQAYAPSAAASAAAPPAYPQPTPYDGVTYQDHGVNPFVDPREDRVSTFALDVDTASYAIAQRYVEDGNRPDPASVRVEEWVNAFDQGYQAPGDDAFAISVDGGPTPFTGPDEVLVRVGLQAREVRDRQRQDASLTFVIDTSGSMERDGRLELVKDALRILVDELGPNDRVAVVTFGDDARLVLASTPADDRRAILRAIDQLKPGGSTNLEAGLRLGYEQARRSLTENGIDRVVVASDGVANVGLTDADGILRGIRDDAANGIELVSVGVGMGNYNDVLLEQLADQGDGFYAYVNGIEDARTLFRDRLTSTLQTVALDAKAQVEFDPRAVDAYRLVGYEDRAIPDGSFTDPRVDAGAVGAGHAVTALYAVRLAEDGPGRDPFATIQLRWTDPDTGAIQRLSRDIRASDLAGTFDGTDPHFRLDAIVAASAEVLRDSPYADHLRIADIQHVADRIRDLPRSDQVDAFLHLLDAMRRIVD